MWGRSRPEPIWEGVELGRLLELVGAKGDWVRVTAASGAYSSCLPVAAADRGVLAWARDGADLRGQEGGPLWFVGPPEYWPMRSVKWAARITVVGELRPALWESRVTDPVGRIPDQVKLPRLRAGTTRPASAGAALRRRPFRDCRDCRHFDDQDGPLAYGWRRAHLQYVKLYHPPGGYVSPSASSRHFPATPTSSCRPATSSLGPPVGKCVIGW